MIGVMARRTKQTKTPTAAQHAEARARAQKYADETGFDVGLEWNEIFGEFFSRTLPRRENRYGYELRVEVVHPTYLAKCQPGHGPGPLANGWVG